MTYKLHPSHGQHDHTGSHHEEDLFLGLVLEGCQIFCSKPGEVDRALRNRSAGIQAITQPTTHLLARLVIGFDLQASYDCLQEFQSPRPLFPHERVPTRQVCHWGVAYVACGCLRL